MMEPTTVASLLIIVVCGILSIWGILSSHNRIRELERIKADVSHLQKGYEVAELVIETLKRQRGEVEGFWRESIKEEERLTEENARYKETLELMKNCMEADLLLSESVGGLDSYDHEVTRSRIKTICRALGEETEKCQIT